MKKVRVYEYAKEIGKQSKDIISVLKDAEIEVSNHMSMLTEEGLAKLDSVFKKVKKEQPKENNTKNKTENNQPKNEKKIKNHINNNLLLLKLQQKKQYQKIQF